MGAGSRRVDDVLSADISVNGQIPDAGIGEAASAPDAGTGNDSPAET
jgi:hypothetical protein